MSFCRFSFLLQTDLHCCPLTQRLVFCAKSSFRFKFFFYYFSLHWMSGRMSGAHLKWTRCLSLAFFSSDKQSFVCDLFVIWLCQQQSYFYHLISENQMPSNEKSYRTEYETYWLVSLADLSIRRILCETVYCSAIKFTLHRCSFKVIQRWWRRRRRRNATT